MELIVIGDSSLRSKTERDTVKFRLLTNRLLLVNKNYDNKIQKDKDCIAGMTSIFHMLNKSHFLGHHFGDSK